MALCLSFPLEPRVLKLAVPGVPLAVCNDGPLLRVMLLRAENINKMYAIQKETSHTELQLSKYF